MDSSNAAIKLLIRNRLGNHIESLTSSITNNEKIRNNIQGKILELEEKISSKSNIILDLKNANLDLNENVKVLKKKNLALQLEIELSKSGKAQQGNEDVRRELETVKLNYETEKIEKDGLKNQVDKLQMKLKETERTKSKESIIERDKHKTRIQELEEEKSDLEKNLVTSEEGLVEKDTLLNSLKDEVDGLKTAVQKSKSKETELNLKLAKAMEANQKIAKAGRQQKKQHQEAIAINIMEVNEMKSNLQKIEQDNKKTIEIHMTEINDLKKGNMKLKDDLKTFESMYEEEMHEKEMKIEDFKSENRLMIQKYEKFQDEHRLKAQQVEELMEAAKVKQQEHQHDMTVLMDSYQKCEGEVKSIKLEAEFRKNHWETENKIQLDEIQKLKTHISQNYEEISLLNSKERKMQQEVEKSQKIFTLIPKFKEENKRLVNEIDSLQKSIKHLNEKLEFYEGRDVEPLKTELETNDDIGDLPYYEKEGQMPEKDTANDDDLSESFGTIENIIEEENVGNGEEDSMENISERSNDSNGEEDSDLENITEEEYDTDYGNHSLENFTDTYAENDVTHEDEDDSMENMTEEENYAALEDNSMENSTEEVNYAINENKENISEAKGLKTQSVDDTRTLDEALDTLTSLMKEISEPTLAPTPQSDQVDFPAANKGENIVGNNITDEIINKYSGTMLLEQVKECRDELRAKSTKLSNPELQNELSKEDAIRNIVKSHRHLLPLMSDFKWEKLENLLVKKLIEKGVSSIQSSNISKSFIVKYYSKYMKK